MKKLLIKKVTVTSSLAIVLGLLAVGQVNAETYKVKSGDTLSQIAKSKQTTVEEIKSLNKLTNADFIQVGQVLNLPEVDEKSEQVNDDKSDKVEEKVEDEETTYSSNLSQADAEAKEIIAFRESSGSYTAQNGQYYGRYQLTLSYLNGDLSPENQERVADAYVAERYGSWTAALAFWNANGWY